MLHRYTWEPDFQICLTDRAKSKTTTISLSSILGHESLPMTGAVEMVEQLMSTAKELKSINLNSGSPPSSFYTTAAITMPRDWVHVSFTNLDSRQLDLYLLVETNAGQEGPSDGSCSSLSTASLDDDMTFSIRYNQTLFAPETVEAMMRSWEALFENVQVSDYYCDEEDTYEGSMKMKPQMSQSLKPKFISLSQSFHVF